MRLFSRPAGEAPARSAESFSNRFFMVLFSLLVGIHCVNCTSWSYSEQIWIDLLHLFQLALYMLLLVKIVISFPYTIAQLVVFPVLIALGALSYLGSRDYDLLVLLVLLVASKGSDPRALVKRYFIIKAVGFVLTLLLCLLGILPNLHFLSGGVSYSAAGFTHRNVLGANATALCLAWFYLRYDRLSVLDLVAWLALDAGLFLLVHSRTTLGMIALICVGVFLFRKGEGLVFRTRWVRRAVPLIFFGMLAVSLWWMLFYDGTSAFWTWLDGIFTNRIRFASQCFEEYGLSLFGQDLPFVSTRESLAEGVDSLILDNAYLRAILVYGLLPGLAFYALYPIAMLKCYDNRDGAALICLALFCVFGLSERYMLDAYYQFPLIVGFQYIFSRESGKNGKALRRIYAPWARR